MQRERAALRQVIEKRRRGLEKERQEVLDAGRRHAVRDVTVEPLLRWIALEELAPAAAKARAAGLVERKLARRQHADLVDAVERALRVDVVRLDTVDQVVVEVEPIGERAAHREEVDDAAAHAHFAGRDHLRHVLVAGRDDLGLQAIEIEPLAGAQEKSVRGDVRRRAHAYHGDVEVAALDAIERRQALRDEIMVRGKLIVGQGLPVGQETHAQLRREPGDLVDQSLRILSGSADDRDRVLFLRQARERQRVGRACELAVASTGGR